MFFSNLTSMSIIIFIILLFLWIIISVWIYKKRKNKFSISFLFLSLFFILINIFEIKWDFNTEIWEIEWLNIVFVLDVSKSMNSIDWLYSKDSISRLELSKKIINSYISNNVNNSYWLIIFAWDSLEILPFTWDSSVFETVLFSLDDTNISKNWTNLNKVFQNLNNYFSSDDEWWLAIILTDWWDDELNLSKDSIKELEKKWVKILLTWIWTNIWTKIPNWKDNNWNDIYKIFNWQEVISKLNEKELKKISSDFNFPFINISNFDNFNVFNDFVNKNLNLFNVKKNIDYRIDYTRFFIFLSFLFFIVFLIFDNFLWIKK